MEGPQPSPIEVKKEIAEQQRSLDALHEGVASEMTPVSPERLQVMDEALAEKRQHLLELSLEDYEEKVRRIEDEVRALYEAFEYSRTRGKGLTEAKLQMLHDGLNAAEGHLRELDEVTPHYKESQERRLLVRLIDEISNIYPSEAVAAAASADLSQLRNLHDHIRVAYQDAEHRLGLDERRRFKGRIAQLAAKVGEAEHHHWLRVIQMTKAKKAAEEIAQSLTSE